MTSDNFILKSISTNFIKSFFIIIFLFLGLTFSYAAPIDEPCTPTGSSDAFGTITGSSDCLTDSTGATANNQASQAAAAAKKEKCNGSDNYNCYTLLEGFGGDGVGGKQTTVIIAKDGLGKYLELIMTYFLMIVTIAAVFFMIYGGILYLTTDIVNKKAEGKEVITRVVIGLIFVFSVWTIMNSINSGLLKNSLNFSLESIGVTIKNAVTGGNTSTSSSTPTSPTPTSPSPSTPPTTPSTPSGITPVPGTVNPNVPTSNKCQVIPDGDLISISGSTKVLKQVAANFSAMKVAASADGITLNVTSGYRTPDYQLELFNRYKCTVINGRSSCPGGKAVALPCSLGGSGSNHSGGDAIDIDVGCSNGQSNCSTPTYKWLKSNGEKYGFKNDLPSDPVHWSKGGR